jgi:hypothetical protein
LSVLAENESFFTMMTITLIGSKGVDHKDGRAGRSPKFLDKAQARHDKSTSSGTVWYEGVGSVPCDAKTFEPVG